MPSSSTVFAVLRHIGIRGAAYATVAARVVELIWAYLETKKPERVRILWNRLFSSAGKILSEDFWRYTLPVLAASLVWGIAYVLYSVIMGHMGSDAVAANSITSIAKSLLSCLIRGVSGGAGVLIGNLLGANELEKAREYGGRLTHLAIAIGVVTGGLLMLISPAIVHFAPLTDTAAEYLQYMLLFCGLNLMAQSVNTTVLDGIFCAGGDAKFDMQGNIGAMWCFSVPLGFLAAFWLKLPVMVVYCIVNLDEIVKLPAVYLHYKKIRLGTQHHPRYRRIIAELVKALRKIQTEWISRRDFVPLSYYKYRNDFTSIFSLQFPPSLLHSDVCRHGHGCRKDSRSYGRSLSGSWNRRPGRHPCRVPGGRSHRSKPGTG